MADLMGMMGKMRELQERVQNMQAELDTLEVTGLSGGGLVSVILTAKGSMKNVSIDPSLLKADKKEIVEDLISAAHADARTKAERVMEDKMKDLTGGLPIPPGLKLF
jgi:DNA-binding YbaB/EbfC family protein